MAATLHTAHRPKNRHHDEAETEPQDVNPGAATAARRIGVTTSPSIQELKQFAILVCRNAGVTTIGPNRINRIATTFTRRFPNGSGWMFFLYLANDVLNIAEHRRRQILANPDVARFIAYADPTGETAVNNVLREQS